MIIFILINSGAEIARVRKGFSHTLFWQVNLQSATITQSAQTTIHPNALRLRRSKINGERYMHICISRIYLFVVICKCIYIYTYKYIHIYIYIYIYINIYISYYIYVYYICTIFRYNFAYIEDLLKKHIYYSAHI